MRIAAVSDLHGYLPEIPPCDLLIVAGDVCLDREQPGGKWAEVDPGGQARGFISRVLPWLNAAPATHGWLLTWGNHDYCGQLPEWESGGSSSTGRIVVDAAVTVAGLKVWLSPWSNRFGGWAFMKDPRDLAPIYESIPDDVDIIVSHGPPAAYGDENLLGMHCGSYELLAAIERVRPQLVVCGHIHEGAGTYDCNGIPIVNASVVDERYRLVRAPTMIYTISGPKTVDGQV